MSHRRQDDGISMPQSPAEMLSAMARMYKYDLSEFEAILWTNQIFKSYEPEAVMRALLAHMEGPAPDSNFMPKYGVIKHKLEPTRGIEDIVAAVRGGSPYVAPAIKDPVLIQAIQQMGGWVKVCAEMPDPREKPIDFGQYIKRFDAAVTAAVSKIGVQNIKPAPLLGISDIKKAQPESLTPLALSHDTAADQGARTEKDAPSS